MFTNNAYRHNSLQDFKDKSKPLIVGSCGTYHLYTQKKLPTYRPKGRVDYQLLYIASGKAHFFFNEEEETILTSGNMIVYRPKEMQKYVYYGEDQTEVYWIHFTGSEAKELLRKHGIKDHMNYFYTGTSLEYTRIFKQMITELQQCQPDHEELLAILLRQIFILIHRQITKERKIKNEYLESEMELALQYFNENYNTDINIENYATSRGMSISWFIRSFKQYTGTTPMQYIVNLRITNSQMLLENTTYSITEIAAIVGYDNPLYFSRLFSKQKGVSPKEYRKLALNHIN